MIRARNIASIKTKIKLSYVLNEKEMNLLCSINCKFLSEIKENSLNGCDVHSAQFPLELFTQVAEKKKQATSHGSKHQFMQY